MSTVISHKKNVTPCKTFCPFPRCKIRRFVVPIRRPITLFFMQCKILFVVTGLQRCIVKLPDEVCISHTKCVEENKAVLKQVRIPIIARPHLSLGIYTGLQICIVKLPDEVCISHMKGVEENKQFYNSRSLQT